jgi:hypothetical protein
MREGAPLPTSPMHPPGGPKGQESLVQARVVLFFSESPRKGVGKTVNSITTLAEMPTGTSSALQQLQPGMAGVFHRGRSKVAPYEG